MNATNIATAILLFAHGSRVEEANQSVRELAAFTIVYPGKINGSLSILWSESRLV